MAEDASLVCTLCGKDHEPYDKNHNDKRILCFSCRIMEEEVSEDDITKRLILNEGLAAKARYNTPYSTTEILGGIAFVVTLCTALVSHFRQ